MGRNMKYLFVSACMAAVMHAISAPAAAQQRDWTLPTRVPVAIVVDPNANYQANEFLIVRRAATFPHDLILIPSSDVKASVLNEAVWTLIAERAANGDTAKADGTLQVRVKSKTVLPWIGRVKGRLASAKHSRVPGLSGEYATLVIWLPPQRARNRAKPQ